MRACCCCSPSSSRPSLSSSPTCSIACAYECGVEAEGSSWGRFNARYYLFAIGFVIFDVEVIFLYPWAAAHAELALDSLAVLWKAALFIGVLAFGLAYAWRRRALEWR